VRTGDDLLADVEERAREHPATFKILPGDERASLEGGDLAQLSFDDVERLWVEVARVRRDGGQVTYHGRLRSVPLIVKVKMTDYIMFEPRNVLKVDRSERGGGEPDFTLIDETFKAPRSRP
jgi:hypothetical protein